MDGWSTMNMKMPKGVEIHNGSVRINFMLNGKREREVIRDMPVNEKTIAYAKSVRELVIDEIERGVFDYQRRFPDSPKVTKAVKVEQAKGPLPAQPEPVVAVAVTRTDGRENLIAALEIAAATIEGKAVVPEVCILFGAKLFRGNRTTKINAESFDAFQSLTIRL